MGDYESLRVWAEAHQITLDAYRITSDFPTTESFGLTSQIRRGAASVAANLAEGAGRNSPGELRRFCMISLGSANQLHYHLRLARDLGFLSDSDWIDLRERVESVRRMLAGLSASVVNPSYNGTDLGGIVGVQHEMASIPAEGSRQTTCNLHDTM